MHKTFANNGFRSHTCPSKFGQLYRTPNRHNFVINGKIKEAYRETNLRTAGGSWTQISQASLRSPNAENVSRVLVSNVRAVYLASCSVNGKSTRPRLGLDIQAGYTSHPSTGSTGERRTVALQMTLLSSSFVKF